MGWLPGEAGLPFPVLLEFLHPHGFQGIFPAVVDTGFFAGDGAMCLLWLHMASPKSCSQNFFPLVPWLCEGNLPNRGSNQSHHTPGLTPR